MTSLSDFGPELPIALLDTLPNPVVVKDDAMRYVWVNSAYEEMFGVSRTELAGRHTREKFPLHHATACTESDRRVLASGQTDETHVRITDRDQVPHEAVVRKSRLTLADGRHMLVGILYDVTEIQATNRELERARDLLAMKAQALQVLADVDPLTGCLNRRALADRTQTLRFASEVGIMLLDLDKFKSINDSFGHAFGDRALKAFAESTRAHLRQTDLFARVGGEEFAIVLPGRTQPETRRVAERIRNTFAAVDLALDGGTVSMTVSIGVVTRAAGPDFDLDAALEAADNNLYAAKGSGRNRVVAAA